MGARGSNGAAGPTGPQGAVGPQGATGPQGAQGAKGPTASQVIGKSFPTTAALNASTYGEVSCPAGTVLLGGGASVWSGPLIPSWVRITQSSPNPTGGSWQGAAIQDATSTGSWTLYIYAVCTA
jgi:hypothetical protein